MSEKDELGQSVDITEDAVRPEEEKSGIAKAVALQYDEGIDSPPIVTASGKGVYAEQILAIAFAQGIKVREDVDLVEVLEKIEIDTPIPVEAFAAVAEILSYVYKANASVKQRRANTMHKE